MRTNGLGRRARRKAHAVIFSTTICAAGSCPVNVKNNSGNRGKRGNPAPCGDGAAICSKRSNCARIFLKVSQVRARSKKYFMTKVVSGDTSRREPASSLKLGSAPMLSKKTHTSFRSVSVNNESLAAVHRARSKLALCFCRSRRNSWPLRSFTAHCAKANPCMGLSIMPSCCTLKSASCSSASGNTIKPFICCKRRPAAKSMLSNSNKNWGTCWGFCLRHP
mmetsp:Transcript_32935/g.60526  ORF Transcript_32935/g.60526 Transcript_32935/m.60526 type:complete len:221 (+) Transcript_32935:1103-1765(+)